jgi:DNA-directed RNA polymerase specialized sigma24 family protein
LICGGPSAEIPDHCLAVFYGYTAREVSELDKTLVGTVKTRIRTGLIRLRSQLGVHDDR